MADKGGNWERQVCKLISKWIQGTEKPYLVWRGRGSGGMFTNNECIGETFAGDIYPISEKSKFLLNKFIFECKSGYPSTSLDNHLKYNKSDYLRDFWIQVCTDADKTSKQPILIYKKKGMSTPWVGINGWLYNKLSKYLTELRFVYVKYEPTLQLPDLYLFEMYQFFDKIIPEIIDEL